MVDTDTIGYTAERWEMNDSVEKDQETELLPVVNSCVAACTKLYKRDHRGVGNDVMSGRSSLQYQGRGRGAACSLDD